MAISPVITSHISDTESDFFNYSADIAHRRDVGVQGPGGLHGEGGDDSPGKHGGHGDKRQPC